ncbi:MAG: helix-turn-helix domain-containing protein [Pseudonocardia sp.]
MPRLDRKVAARLPSGSQRVLDIMRSAESPMGTGQIAEMLGMSRPTATLRLRALEGEGLIRWKGKSAQDPRAVWQLTED